MIVDTPGFCDTGDIDQESAVRKAEVCRCLLFCAPGPHAFIFVVRIGYRFPEYNETVGRIRELFGEKCMDYMIVVFTGLDLLHQDEESDGQIKLLEQYIEEGPREIGQLVTDCGGRYVGFNNRCKLTSITNKEQVETLLRKVKFIIKVNKPKGPFYTTEMLKEVERVMKERDEK